MRDMVQNHMMPWSLPPTSPPNRSTTKK
jgi:glucose-6-phosphate 1-dehydrogenase